MAHVAHKQHAAPWQGQGAAIGQRPLPVAVQRAGHRLPALLEAGDQIAAHQPQPIAIGGQLILSIHRRDGILQIDNGRERGLQHDISQSRLIGFAHQMRRIDHQLDMQPMMCKQHAAGLGRDKRRRIGQRGRRAVPVAPTSRRQWQRRIQKRAPRRDHRAPARLIIAAGQSRWGIERIGAIPRIIQAAPARIGGIEHKPIIERRHHQLRPRHQRNLGVNILRANGKWRWFGHKIANLAQKRAVCGHIKRLARARAMPRIDLRLQRITLGQQRAAHRREPLGQCRKSGPECVWRNGERGQHIAVDKSSQSGINLQSGLGDMCVHVCRFHWFRAYFRGPCDPQRQSWDSRTTGRGRSRALCRKQIRLAIEPMRWPGVHPGAAAG